MWLLDVLKWLIWRPLQAVIAWIYNKIHKVIDPIIVVPYHRYLYYSFKTPIQSVYEELRRQQPARHLSSSSPLEEDPATVIKRIEPWIREIIHSCRESNEENSSSMEELDAFLHRRPFSRDAVECVIQLQLESDRYHEVQPQIQTVLTKLKCAAEARSLFKILASFEFSHDNPLHREILDRLWEDVETTGVDTSTEPTDSTLPYARYASSTTDSKGRDWSILGFQRSSGPESDLRSVGILGLLQFWAFVRSNPETTKTVVEKTDLPFRGYPLALVSLHVTHWLLDKSQEGYMDERLYTLNDNQSAQFLRLLGAPTDVDRRTTTAEEWWISQLSHKATDQKGKQRAPDRIEDAFPDSIATLNRLHASMIESFDSIWEQGKKRNSKRSFTTVTMRRSIPSAEAPASVAQYSQVWNKFIVLTTQGSAP
eukprot:gb/GECG01006505.1/.p1 GENE.gb/GECG01006505.1/~~gb/GECG01006505.1/.p1  ORF type:complete len:425 (+),score=44.60 gb/GECG01006505.1/:1-1275(+)